MSAGSDPSCAPPDGPQKAHPEIVHATCVACYNQAVLIVGASGSGKSALALQMMALGGVLVADDRTLLRVTKGGVFADAPDTLRGLIEARGVGILRAATAGPTRVAVVVDMDTPETARLPDPYHRDLLGQSVPLLRRVDGPHFAAAIVQYLAGGREA